VKVIFRLVPEVQTTGFEVKFCQGTLLLTIIPGTGLPNYYPNLYRKWKSRGDIRSFTPIE
jgi:hypothetical protein